MRRWQPIVTLFAGLAVALVMLGLGYRATVHKADPAAGQQTPAGAAAQAAAGTPPSPTASASPAPAVTKPPAAKPPAAKPPAAKPAPPLHVTWAGEVKGAGTLAITAKGDKAVAYICDGRRLESWFAGTAKAGKLSLTANGGARLTGTFAHGRATGRVTVDGRTLKFDLATVKKPSGLYRATANVRGAKIVGGWIRLPNGKQVGLATVDGMTVIPSTLDTATGTATIDGVTVQAAPVAGELR